MDLLNATPLPERRKPLSVFGTPSVWQDELLPPPAEPLHQTSEQTLWDTDIIHTIPGRIRLRVPVLKGTPGLAGSLEALLAAQPGIARASVNSRCQSLTVIYDSFYWSSDSLCAFLRQLRCEEIALYELLQSPENEAPSWIASWIRPAICWKALGYFTLVIGIILAALPMIPGGIPFLFLSTVCFARAARLHSGEQLTAA